MIKHRSINRMERIVVNPMTDHYVCYMGVSINGDTPKWMVYNGKSHSNGWFGGYTYFRKPPYMVTFTTKKKKNIHVSINLPWKHTDPSWVFERSSFRRFPDLVGGHGLILRKSEAFSKANKEPDRRLNVRWFWLDFPQIITGGCLESGRFRWFLQHCLVRGFSRHMADDQRAFSVRYS